MVRIKIFMQSEEKEQLLPFDNDLIALKKNQKNQKQLSKEESR